MAFWSTQTSEPLRQYRWVVTFGSELDPIRYALKKVDKPKATIGEITHKYLNHEFYYPGRLKWDPINMTFAAVTNASATEIVNNVLIKAGYGVPTDNTSSIYLSSIGKNKFNTAIGLMEISQINPEGEVIERWTLNNPFFTSVQFGTLDYGSEEIVEITCTVKYDWARLSGIQNLDDAAPGINPDFP